MNNTADSDDLWLPYLGRIGAVSRHTESMFLRFADYMQAPCCLFIVSAWADVGEGCRMALRLPSAE